MQHSKSMTSLCSPLLPSLELEGGISQGGLPRGSLAHLSGAGYAANSRFKVKSRCDKASQLLSSGEKNSGMQIMQIMQIIKFSRQGYKQ